MVEPMADRYSACPDPGSVTAVAAVTGVLGGAATPATCAGRVARDGVAVQVEGPCVVDAGTISTLAAGAACRRCRLPGRLAPPAPPSPVVLPVTMSSVRVSVAGIRDPSAVATLASVPPLSLLPGFASVPAVPAGVVPSSMVRS